MTMLDDDRLASLFSRAGDAFAVPASGPDDILTLAARRPAPRGGEGTESGVESEDRSEKELEIEVPKPSGRARRLAAATGRHRLLAVAACFVVLLVLAGALGTALRGPSHPTLTAGLPHAGRSVPAHGSPTTTLPHGPSASAGTGSPQFGVNAAPSKGLSSAGSTSGGPAVTTPTSPPLPNDAVGQSAKIEQTGSLSLTIGKGDLGRSMAALASMADAAGGFVANSQSQSGAGTGGAPTGTVTVQVPVDSFATVLQQAQKLGNTTSLTTKATDVTGQYVDLQSRIAALQASRQQYLTIMAKATSVGDVLAVQAQLDTIQSQIEQLQGQLQVLSSETSYSALTTTLRERGAPATPPRPSPVPESGLVQAWHDSVGGFVAGIEGVIRVAGPLLFALLCLGAVLLGGRALWRRVQRHRL